MSYDMRLLLKMFFENLRQTESHPVSNEYFLEKRDGLLEPTNFALIRCCQHKSVFLAAISTIEVAAQLFKMTQESWAPSLSPVAASSAVVPPTSAPTVLPNNFTTNNPNEIPMINFILYLFMCMVVLVGLVFCNQYVLTDCNTFVSIGKSSLTRFFAETEGKPRRQEVLRRMPQQRIRSNKWMP